MLSFTVKPLRKKPEKECKVCAKVFTARRKTQIFCSRSCQNREYYRTLRSFAAPGLDAMRLELKTTREAEQLEHIAALIKHLTEPSIHLQPKLPFSV